MFELKFIGDIEKIFLDAPLHVLQQNKYIDIGFRPSVAACGRAENLEIQKLILCGYILLQLRSN
jgi:hypothetical protein